MNRRSIALFCLVSLVFHSPTYISATLFGNLQAPYRGQFESFVKFFSERSMNIILTVLLINRGINQLYELVDLTQVTILAIYEILDFIRNKFLRNKYFLQTVKNAKNRIIKKHVSYFLAVNFGKV
jgi:hypothetical protein